MSQWDLFIDESGTFDETKDGGGSSDGRRFPSLLAGIVAPRDAFTVNRAEQLLTHAYAGPPPEIVHGTESSKKGYNKRLARLGEALSSQSKLRAVRIVNRERLDFGDRVATYTNMLAELCVRVFEDLSRNHEGRIWLEVHYARWMVDGVQVPEGEYQRRLEERLAFALVRRGKAAQSRDWRIRQLRAVSGRKDRRAQICDLLCNGSHDDFCRCNAEARAALEAAFGERNYTWTVRALTERVDGLEAAGSIGYALHEIASAMPALEGEARAQAELQLRGLIDRLATMDAAARNVQLDGLVSWLKQLAEHRSDLALGLRAANWCIAEIAKPLVARVDDVYAKATLFTFERLALTASNHLGDLARAHTASEAMNELVPALTGRWEHAQTLLEALIHQAVHLNDTLRPDEAAQRMKAVAGYYEELGSLFHAALPTIFPPVVRSDLRGQALGTWLQAEMIAGLDDPVRVAVARNLSDQALEEFAAQQDRDRQAQYRAQLETYAADWPAARRWLATSLGDPDAATHDALGSRIAGLDGFAQGFALLHWSRIGALAALAGASDEAAAFAGALRLTKLLASSWLVDEQCDYPAHGIRRWVAVVDAYAGAVPAALSTLGKLRLLEPEPAAHPIMDLTIIAAHLEVAALVAPRDERAATRLLQDEKRGGVVAQARQTQQRIPHGLSALTAFLDEVSRLDGEAPPSRMRALARTIAD